MKNIMYSCDLCKETKEVDELLGYKLIGTCPNHPKTSKKTIELIEDIEDVKIVDNHICFTCSDKILDKIIKFRDKIATD